MVNLNNIQLDKQKKILIVIFFILIVYIDYSFVLKAQRAGLSSLGPKIARLNTDLENLNRGLENMRLNKSSSVLSGPNKATGSSRIITENQVSWLLQEISSAANKFDIRIAQIRPSRLAQSTKPAVGLEKLTPILINLDMLCDYHSLGKLIQDLENSSVFMGVDGMEVATELPDYMKQKITLVIKTYVTK